MNSFVDLATGFALGVAFSLFVAVMMADALDWYADDE